MFLLKWMLISLFIASPALAEEWPEHRSRVVGHIAKIEYLEGNIRRLIQEKKRIESPEKIREILKSLVDYHQQLTETAEKKNKELKHMRFRHPDRGAEFDQKYYKTYQVKSLRDFEDELGVGGQLSKIKEKIEKHYGVKPEDRQKPIKPIPEEETKEAKRIRLSK